GAAMPAAAPTNIERRETFFPNAPVRAYFLIMGLHSLLPRQPWRPRWRDARSGNGEGHAAATTSARALLAMTSDSLSSPPAPRAFRTEGNYFWPWRKYLRSDKSDFWLIEAKVNGPKRVALTAVQRSGV